MDLNKTLVLYINDVYILQMSDETQQFNLDALSQLAGLPVRTIRYYIQSGFVAKPTGVGRGAHYNTTHLEQLLEIKKWQDAGLSLTRIQMLLEGRDGSGLIPPKPAPKPGHVAVWSRVHIHDGVEVHLDPQASGLTPEQSRAFLTATLEAFERITSESKQDALPSAEDES